MKRLLRVAGMFFAAELCTAALPPATPIMLPEDLRDAALHVPVARIDFVLPDNESAAEEALAKRFFNRPEEHRYSGMTTVDWIAKWQLFTDALIAKAKSQNFDSRSLELCLRALNRGRNRQTMLWPAPVQKLFSPGTPQEEVEAFERAAEEKYQLALKERERRPEEWYNESLAVVPVAAYLGRYLAGC